MRLIFLGVVALAAPWLACLAANPIGAESQYLPLPAREQIPSVFQLCLLTATTLVAVALRRSYVAGYLRGSLRSAVYISILWAVTGAALWLALLFFAGALGGIDRYFPFAFVVVLTALLVMTWIVTASRMQFAAFLAGLAVLLCWAGWPALAGLTAQGADPGFIVTRLLGMPLVVATTFVAAALIAGGVLSRQLADSGGLKQAFVLIVWIIVSHFLWLLLLFPFGVVADVARWLPLATAMTMGLVGVAVSAAWALRKGGRGIADLIYAGSRADADDTRAELIAGPAVPAAAPGRRAWVISYTGVSNEPRVLRQCEALVANGWEVVVCGYDGRSPRPPEWHFIRLPARAAFRGLLYPLASLLHGVALQLLRFVPPGPLFNRIALLAHSTNLYWLHIRLELCRLARLHPELKPALVIAHDYHTADVAYSIAKMHGAKFSIDLHEYAKEQYSNDPSWVKTQQPVIVGVQDQYLRRADIVTVVCEGIAELVAKETPLRREPVVIRNLPFQDFQPFRPVGERIKVLYHGDLSRHRYIDVAIESMKRWREDIDFILRGGGDPAYIGELKRLVERLGLDRRVFFEPPVPFNRIVQAANEADIGFFSYEIYSPQIRLALPNKLFEYVMAGLAVCATDLVEVGRIVRGYKLGKLIPQHLPESIAETINSFTRDEIESCKRASIAAAKELAWQSERGRMLQAYDGLFKQPEDSRGESFDLRAVEASVGPERR